MLDRHVTNSKPVLHSVTRCTVRRRGGRVEYKELGKGAHDVCMHVHVVILRIVKADCHPVAMAQVVEH